MKKLNKSVVCILFCCIVYCIVSYIVLYLVLYCIILCCIVLYLVLYCVVYCVVLCCIVYCVVLCCIVYCVVLCCIVLCYVVCVLYCMKVNTLSYLVLLLALIFLRKFMFLLKIFLLKQNTAWSLGDWIYFLLLKTSQSFVLAIFERILNDWKTATSQRVHVVPLYLLVFKRCTFLDLKLKVDFTNSTEIFSAGKKINGVRNK